MKKLTATEFAALKPAQAYSAYDDAFGVALEARRAQANAISDAELAATRYKDEINKLNGDHKVELDRLKKAHSDAVAKLEAEIEKLKNDATALKIDIGKLTSSLEVAKAEMAASACRCIDCECDLAEEKKKRRAEELKANIEAAKSELEKLS